MKVSNYIQHFLNRMHSDQIFVSKDLVRALLAEQLPEFATLELEEMLPPGTDNYMYRLGKDKILRLPRLERSAFTLEKEIMWLPKFTHNMSVHVPKIIAVGKRTKNYPFQWLVTNFLEGTNPGLNHDLDLTQAAHDLANFITNMQKVSTQNAPLCKRGKPLSTQDSIMQESIDLLDDEFDKEIIKKIWETALKADEWDSSPVWIHGDLHHGNMLFNEGKLSGIIDFGMAGIGDPAADYMVAWILLDKASRSVFRDLLKPDEATWKRGIGWALCLGVVAYPYYKDSNPEFAAVAKRAMKHVVNSRV